VTYARRCAQALNALHSIPYFTDDLGAELAPFGVTDHSSVYLAGRAAPLGVTDPAVVTAVFNSFAPGLVSARLPGLWQDVSPARAIEARQAAAGAALRRLLGDELIHSADMAEAAKLATVAATAGQVPGRPLYAANTALEQPEPPHLALWHAATMLREHRGDGHVAVLGHFEITGVAALVIDCASAHGMDKQIVMPQRGWSADQWAAAQERLEDRGLIRPDGTLTSRGATVRDQVERETSRLDRQPYEALGAAATEKLATFVHDLVHRAAQRDVFPPPLRAFFAPDSARWTEL
jgi:hypothetical protein